MKKIKSLADAKVLFDKMIQHEYQIEIREGYAISFKLHGTNEDSCELHYLDNWRSNNCEEGDYLVTVDEAVKIIYDNRRFIRKSGQLGIIEIIEGERR